MKGSLAILIKRVSLLFGRREKQGPNQEPAEVIISHKTVAFIPQPDGKRTLVVTATIENIGKSTAINISVMAEYGECDPNATSSPMNWAPIPDELRRVDVSYVAPGEKAQVTIPVAIQESYAQCSQPNWLLRVTCFESLHKKGKKVVIFPNSPKFNFEKDL